MKRKYTICLFFILTIALYNCTTYKTQQTKKLSSKETWTSVPCNSSSIYIIGRATKPSKEKLSISWSGSSVLLGFHGSAARVRISASGNVFDVIIDNDTLNPLTLDLTNASDTLFTTPSLNKGNHYLSFYKRTEASIGTAIFQNFEVLGFPSEKALPITTKRKIEFIGNSITCGYGILASDRNQPFKATTEDASKSYASIAAKSINAEPHLISISGKGFYRNADGTTNETLGEIYRRVDYSKKETWDFSSWIPDIVVINLGTNDFAKGIPDSLNFADSAIALVNFVQNNYPEAAIVLIDGPMLSDWYPTASATDSLLYPIANSQRAKDYINENGTIKSLTICKRFLDAIFEHFKSGKNANIYRLSFEAQGSLGYGADWHPSKAQAQKDGENLAKFLKTTLGL